MPGKHSQQIEFRQLGCVLRKPCQSQIQQCLCNQLGALFCQWSIKDSSLSKFLLKTHCASKDSAKTNVFAKNYCLFVGRERNLQCLIDGLIKVQLLYAYMYLSLVGSSWGLGSRNIIRLNITRMKPMPSVSCLTFKLNTTHLPTLLTLKIKLRVVNSICLCALDQL
jgi:hypothetical protein